MSIQGDQLRMAADGFEDVLGRVWQMRTSSAPALPTSPPPSAGPEGSGAVGWTGAAAERFDHELLAWRRALHEIAADIRAVAARVDREITGQ